MSFAKMNEEFNESSSDVESERFRARQGETHASTHRSTDVRPTGTSHQKWHVTLTPRTLRPRPNAP